MKYKSDALSCFKTFKLHVENLGNTKIKFFRSDNGGEFINLQFQTFLPENGIFFQSSCPHTPEQNGVAERKHRHISETGRTLINHSSVPLSFWVEAFQTAVFLINRLPTPILNHISPIQKLFKKIPDYSIAKVFGSLCFRNLTSYVSNKLEPRSTPCVFIGYSPHQKGYRCLSLAT